IVQEMVNGQDWCGGKDMGFVIKWTGGAEDGRPIYSYDNDTSRAARLHIEFDENTVYAGGEGCLRQNVSVQVRRNGDDAEEFQRNGTVDSGRRALVGSDNAIFGLRFTEVPIPKGAKVVSAELDLTNYARRRTSAGAGTWTIRGQASASAQTFLETPQNLSSRRLHLGSPELEVEVTVPPTRVRNNERFKVPGLEGILQKIIGDANWKGGNSLALIIAPSDSGANIHSYDSSAAKAPFLRATIEYNLGDLPGGVVATRTVKDRLREIVDGLTPQGATPLVDTLYEASRYYQGQSVVYGKTRGKHRKTKPLTRVSHPDSYTGGTVVRARGCTEANLDASACSSERIDDSPIYKNPITDSCQTNYIVLLTDGMANDNASVDDVQSDYSLTCATKYTGVDSATTVSSGDKCGPDIAAHLFENDLNDNVDGINNVKTYTVGFGLENEFIRDVARRGGGSAYRANNAVELTNVFRTIVGDIIERTTTFTAPALTVNAFNQLAHSDDVYMALFEPKSRQAWPGNLKKYKLCDTVGVHSTCSLGEVLDADDLALVGGDGHIKSDSRSTWAAVDDGDQGQSGGAAAEIVAQGARTVYTYLDTATAPQAQTAANRNLAEHLLLDSDIDGAIDNITTFATGNALDATRSLLGLDPAATVAAANEHINWIRGIDVDDEDSDDNRTEARYPFGDALHSEPQVVTYGARNRRNPEDSDVTKVFVGSNDGGLRMINAHNGKEEWIFFPQSVLAMQNQLRDNRAGDHLYGIDGTPTIWRKDHNRDGYIVPRAPENDFVRVIVGMRRGGNEYYALDVTPGRVLRSRTAHAITPKFLWRIKGGSAEYPRLGQTWSRPLLRRIRVGTTAAGRSELKTVMFVAAGYDANHDRSYKTADSLGNGFYIVDPENGRRLFYASGTKHATGNGVDVPGMVYPVPSDLALIDSDGDLAIDRVYFADLGGQVWRVDIKPDLSATAGIKGVAGRLASLSFDKTEDPAAATPPLADQRRFFYRPDVVRVRNDGNHSSIANYDLVMVTSGNRAHPLESGVDDRFYALRDYVTGKLSESLTHPGLADGYRVDTTNPTLSMTSSAGTIQGKLAANGVLGDLPDRSSLSETLTGRELSDLKTGKGFFVEFALDSEKGLARTVTLEGTVYFSTYVAQASATANRCQPAEGRGRFYRIHVLNASALHQTAELGPGIPSRAVPVFQIAKLAPDPNDPNGQWNIANKGVPFVGMIVQAGEKTNYYAAGDIGVRLRTYWYEEGVN
ncbi:MAG: pilus assembly protein, partial [Gammaproteobacteria bacterium]